MSRRRAKPRFRFPGGTALVLIGLVMLVLLVPSAGPLGQESDMLAAPEPTPDITPTPTPTPIITPEPTPDITPTPEITPEPTVDITPTPEISPEPTVEPTPTPTPEITPEPTPDITPEPTPTPEPTATIAPDLTPAPDPQPTASTEPDFTIRVTPEPTAAPAVHFPGEPFDRYGDGTMIVRLPMDDFSGGSPMLEEGFSHGGYTYSDSSITVKVYQEKVDYTIYTVADVTIADASQLRTAIAGTTASAARSRLSKLAERVNAVVAIDGDYYADRKGAYAVRQGALLSGSLSSDLDLLVIDYNGDFHGILASEKKEALPQWEGQIYQCLCFGPVLIRDGEKIDYNPRYAFGLNYLNPRAGIGQIGERHYLFVVASGRIDNSMSITAARLRDYMYEKGCFQAYNVDGGASAELVYAGKIVSPLTNSGERGLYDMIYFASTAGMEAGQ